MPEPVSHALVRLISLVSWLGQHQGATIQEIASHFDRTRRQVKRDIEYLGNVGDSLPGASFEIDWAAYTETGQLFLRTTMGAHLPPRLSEDEAMALLVSLEAITETLDDELCAHLPRTIMKIGALTGVPHSSIFLKDTQYRKHNPKVAVIRDAIQNKYAITFDYVNNSGKCSHRYVDPRELSRGPHEWSLLGWCHENEEERTFLLSRMTHICILKTSATQFPHKSTGTPKETQNLTQTPSLLLNAEQPQPQCVPIKLRTPARWIVDDYSLRIIDEDEGAFTVDFPLWNDQWVDSVLMDVAPHILDCPSRIRQRLHRRATRALHIWETIGVKEKI
ncbi:helix-turn-helix transcriptional regulator [Schaalia sp. lx-260]|uniref:helix-turn-helix transcriptional regulator n=1 Tax=Schaalia sp. lx-260 TaxID=2899082 RepID=UPI001E4E03A7|nr:WYL domain-containing protein [Schaalia sp. lx-260]MCD4549425.1 WYL domain-containing protein [Schaalia sp. lx-260]